MSATVQATPLTSVPTGVGMSPVAPGRSGQADTVRLIDQNQFPPDGTVERLEALAKALSQTLSFKVFVGIVIGQNLVRTDKSPSENALSGKSDTGRDFIVENGLREAATATKNCNFATQENQSSLVLQSLRQELEAKCVLGFGISDLSVLCGVILVLSDKTTKKSGDDIARTIDQLRKELASWIAIWILCYNGRMSRHWATRLEKLSSFRRYWKLVVIGLCAGVFLPIPYWPQRDCLIEPTLRRFLTSPTDGRVLDAKVRPGDMVQPNQLLARIDDEQIRCELAKAEAEYQQAQKKRDAAMASRSGGEARLADLEKERIAAQVRSLQSQLNQLEIRSPIEGVVIAGDWLPTAGAAVQRADTLFEIAPLEKMRIQALLTTEDLGLITVGTPMTIRVDAAYGKKWEQTIQRIDPRGRPENSQVVFYAETDVDNQSQVLRPGMRGSVRLAPGMKSLGWIIFHRPYLWLMKKLAW